MEENTAYLTCSSEFNEVMKIATIKYEKGTCNHNDVYGIGNLCNGRTECLFKVTNSNVGSSCGANGTASLGVTYNCIRNGGWSEWKNATTSCPVNCGGALQNVTRTCTNPTPNELGSLCSGTNFLEQICNDNACPLAGTVCKDSGIVWTCQSGYIQMIHARWKASNGCGEPGNYSNFDVVREMKEICNYRKSCTCTAKDSTFKLSCRQQFKTCSQLEYEYICKDAQWNSWTKWSLCSKSCGTGEHYRTRNCSNQFYTTDGYFVNCDGSSVETRVCNTDQCPYCGDTNFNNELPKPLSELKEDTSPGSGILHLNGIFYVKCCGRIKTWEFIPVKAGNLTFVILRKTEDYKYKCVGFNEIHISALDLHTPTEFDVADSERIVIIQRDIIGWYGNNIGYYDCIARTKACPLSLRLNDPVNVGDIIDIHRLSNLSNRIYAFNYSTTENRPVTINISSEPVTIPDHLNVDSFVMTISILDPDYGDYIQDFKLDYQNEYFYLDTQQRSVHVKKALPHLVGHSNATLNFTCIVQDSFFNLANITITIISFNVPPAVTDLPDVLILDSQQLSDNSRFHIFRVEDPSNDNVSCGLSKISPSTDRLTLEMDGNEAFIRVFKYSTSNTTLEYELEIYCDDGTDETIIKLIMHFISKKNSESAELKIIYVSGSLGGLLLIVIIIVVFYYHDYCFSKRRKTLITSKSSNDSKSNSLYTSIIYDNAAVNPYDNIEQIGNKQIPTDHFEMSQPDTNLYENTKIFI
ncbi:uncharacterized protein [Mytilus edulis]